MQHYLRSWTACLHKNILLLKYNVKIDESDIPTLPSKKFNESFFGYHKFSNNEKGSMESLKKIKRKDIISYKKKIF